MKLGSFLNIEGLNSNAETAIEVADKTIELAELVKDNQDLKDLSFLTSMADAVVEISKSDEFELITGLAEALLPISKLAGASIKYIAKKNAPDSSTFSACIVLLCYRAYISSICEHSKKVPIKKGSAPNLIKAKDIKNIEISEQQAKNALLRFPQSYLADCLKAIAASRLEQMGLDDSTINVVLVKALWETPKRIVDFWKDIPPEISQYAPDTVNNFLVRLGNQQKIDNYLEKAVREDIRGNKLLLRESKVDLEKLYVPLNVCSVLENGDIDKNKEPQNVHSWIENILLSEHTYKIMLIEGSSGQGKTALCKMLLYLVKERLYPAFTPLLINLKNITKIEEDLSNTLKSGAGHNLRKIMKADNWLDTYDKRFLLILDGLDELLPSSGYIEDFIVQIKEYQKNEQHQFLITGRSLYADFFKEQLGHEEGLLEYTVGVKLQPMDLQKRKDWIARWSEAIGGKNSQSLREDFTAFVDSCPDDIIRGLAGEPLSLSLLAQLFREKKINSEELIDPDNATSRTRIYREALNTAIKRTTPSFRELSRSENLEKNHLIDFLTSASVYYVHFGYKPVKLSVISQEFDSSHPLHIILKENRYQKLLKKLIESCYASLTQEGRNSSRKTNELYVDFRHKSFGEYLFAKRIKALLAALLRKPFSEICTEIYLVLGQRSFSVQIIEYITLEIVEDESMIQSIEKLLFKLQHFYSEWIKGNSFHQYLTEYFKHDEGHKSTADAEYLFRRTDAYVGLNILVVMLSLYKYVRSNGLQGEFFPCLCGDTEELSKEKREGFLRVAGYSYSLDRDKNASNKDTSIDDNFKNIVRKFLSDIDLSFADLQGINLEGADLRNVSFVDSNLSRANLYNADLRGARMDSANLSGADLRKAKISGLVLKDATLNAANLSGLDLSLLDKQSTEGSPDSLSGIKLEGANLNGTNLSGASLYKAQLTNLNLSSYNLRYADFSEADLSNTNLANADLQYAKFRADEEGCFENTIFKGAYLECADFDGADLTGVNLSFTVLRRATFKGAALIKTAFNGADLSGVIMENVLLEDTNFTNATLTGVSFQGSIFRNVHMTGANLEGADLRGANLTEANVEDMTVFESALSDISTQWS